MLFDQYLGEMPTIRRLVTEGASGRLRTCEPPITVPAWMVMSTGVSPERLGIYGFRHRAEASYGKATIVDSTAWDRHPAVWNAVQDAGGRVGLFAVPPGYPPQVVTGWSVGCHLTPSSAARWAHPPQLQDELEQVIGGRYQPDIPFRIEDRDRVLDALTQMTQQHLTMVEHLMQRHPCDFTMLVEIGTDRLHHAFWKFADAAHPQHVPNHRYGTAVRDYYRLIDAMIARLLARAGDDTVVMITSDHGAKAMHGLIGINEWLQQQGYLVLHRPAPAGTPIDAAAVDWSRTTAWGWGGYCAKIFLNLEGREPQGIVPRRRYHALCTELVERLQGLTIPVVVRQPNPQGEPNTPDLMVYFGDLHWRAGQTVGHERVFLDHNDTGLDDAVHSWDGVIVLWDPRRRVGRELTGARLVDVAPTMLDLMGLPRPNDLEGRSLAGILA